MFVCFFTLHGKQIKSVRSFFGRIYGSPISFSKSSDLTHWTGEHFESVVFSWQCASPPQRERRAAATLLAWKTEWMIDKSSGARLSCCRLHTSLACLRLCSRVQRHHPISSCSSKETRWLLDGVVYSMISITRPGCLRLSGLETTWDIEGQYALVQKILSNIIMQSLKISKLRNIQTKKVSQ